ncbi:MAG: hypothetical protein ACOY4R_25945 [Pseudomonadota bacterium]
MKTTAKRPYRSMALALLVAALLGSAAVDASAQQFGGARRVEVPMDYPFTAVGRWTFNAGGGRGTCTAFLVNNCTLVTASRCGQAKAARFQFEASDGQRYPVRNVVYRESAAGKSREAAGEAMDTTDFEVAFGQIAAGPGQPLPGEKYGRFGFDPADTVAATAGFTPHCSYGFSMNKEGRNGRGTLDPDVYVWGSLRSIFPDRADGDESFLHMTNGVYGTSGSPIFRCTPAFDGNKFQGIEVGAPARLIGVFIRLSNDKDKLKFADRLRVPPDNMAWGVGGQQFYSGLADYVKEHPCEALR